MTFLVFCYSAIYTVDFFLLVALNNISKYLTDLCTNSERSWLDRLLLTRVAWWNSSERRC